MKQSNLTPYTVKDTGVELLIKKVSPFILTEIRRKNPAPTPPIVTVNYGTETEPDTREEENPNDPAYIASLREYGVKIQTIVQSIILELGVVITLTDEMKEELRETREINKRATGHDLEEKNDKLAYILYCALGTPNDVTELVEAITSRSVPQAEGVSAYRDSFRSDVQG